MRRAGRWLGRGLAALGLLFALVTVTPVVRWMGLWLGGTWDKPRGDVLVVLTGSSLESDVIGESSYWRSVYAVMTWREGGWREIWISGTGDGPRPAAGVMKEFLIGQSVPADRVHVETVSRNTRESAREMAKILAGERGRVVLLTSDFHMFRSRRLFAREGLRVGTRPVPDAGKRGSRAWTRWSGFLDVCEELVKIVWYKANGWI